MLNPVAAVMVFTLWSSIALSQAPSPAPAPPIRAVEWMAGCWTGQRGDQRFTESWLKANDEELFGVSYTIGRAGKVQEFEFMHISVRQGRLSYSAQPNGRAETVFTHTPGSNPREAIFANPTHDYPKRVAYRETPGGLLAWIDDGDQAGAKRIEYPMTRTSCDPKAK